MQDDGAQPETPETRLARTAGEAEDAMIERMRRLPLPDAVFAYVLHWQRHFGDDRYIARRPLSELVVAEDPADVQAALRRVRALLDDAFRYGDAAHSQRERAAREGPVSGARDLAAEMRRDHPGFSDETYSAAMHRGLFLAR